MPIPSLTIVARHRRRSTHRPARRPIPILTITAVVGFVAGIAIAATADDTGRGVLAVLAATYLCIFAVHRIAQHFDDTHGVDA